MENLLVLISFCFGAIIGSFLNVVILRLPKEESLSGRSHCKTCGHILGIMDLFPLFSYIFLRGRCRFCKAKISPRYFILEAVTGLLFMAAFYFIQPANLFSAVLLLKYWVILAALVVVFVVDMEHLIILDEVIFPVMGGMVFINLILDVVLKAKVLSLGNYSVSGILGAVLLWGMFFLVWFLSSGKWLGFGDVKLAILLGLTLGFPLTFVGLMMAVLIGGVVAVFLLVFGGKTLKTQIPFGTFLSLGTVLALFYGEKLLGWYLAILGF